VKVSKQQVELVIKNSKFSQDYLHWSIGYIDLSYQFNTPEYYESSLEQHLLETYAEGGNFESKSKTGVLVQFKKAIVASHGKITYKIMEQFNRDRICDEWCEHQRLKKVGRYIAEAGAIVAGIVLISQTGEPHIIEKAVPFAAGLFLKLNRKMDKYCKCKKEVLKIEDKENQSENVEKEKIKTLEKLEKLRKTLEPKEQGTINAIDELTKKLKKIKN
jgi:hypothetical protein